MQSCYVLSYLYNNLHLPFNLHTYGPLPTPTPPPPVGCVEGEDGGVGGGGGDGVGLGQVQVVVGGVWRQGDRGLAPLRAVMEAAFVIVF